MRQMSHAKQHGHWLCPQTSNRSRLIIGPACLPLLMLVVMSPATVAALKHTLVQYVGECIDLPSHSAPAAGPPTAANQHSISLRCLWLCLFWQPGAGIDLVFLDFQRSIRVRVSHLTNPFDHLLKVFATLNAFLSLYTL